MEICVTKKSKILQSSVTFVLLSLMCNGHGREIFTYCMEHLFKVSMYFLEKKCPDCSISVYVLSSGSKG